MTSRIVIPFRVIQDLSSSALDLAPHERCSRCDAQPAEYYETHLVKFQAGFTRYRTFSRKFSTSKSFQLRLPLCGQCQRMNFTEAPETMRKDDGPLGRLARWRSVGIALGTISAGIAFILLMKFVPLPAPYSQLGYFWLYPVSLSLFFFLMTFGLTALKSRGVIKSLINENYDIQLHRASVTTTMQYEMPGLDDAAVVIEIENDRWAAECASLNKWEYQKTSNLPEKE
jgi:hypothetical protein